MVRLNDVYLILFEEKFRIGDKVGICFYFLFGVIIGDMWYLGVNKFEVSRGDLGCCGGKGLVFVKGFLFEFVFCFLFIVLF